LNIKEDIIEEIIKLDKALYKIQCKNWIESMSSGTGAAGLTLEKLLGKAVDNDVLPDFNKIELKTRNRYSRYPLHLFSCAFDNRPLEMKRLLNIGGYPDKNNPQFKVFQINVDAISDKSVGKFSYRLFVNYEKEIVELLIKYRNSEIIYTKMSWSFHELKSRLEHKLNYLVIVNVLRDKINDKFYFKYYERNFYKLKCFNTFLTLIENGSINVSFKLTYYHSGERYGEYMDKGTGFEISYSDIPKLFDIIDL